MVIKNKIKQIISFGWCQIQKSNKLKIGFKFNLNQIQQTKKFVRVKIIRMNQLQSQALMNQLKIRFQKKPRRCRKTNDSSIGYAQRIVSISNNTFYYYPTIQQFQDMDFDKLQYVIPKAGVKLQDILQLKFPPRRTNQRNYFSIILPKNKILKFTKAMKQIIVDQYAQGQQIWTFNFNYDIVSLPQRQYRQKQAMHQQLLKQKQRQQELKKQRQQQQKIQKQKIRQQYNSLLQAQQMQIQQDQDYKKKRQELNQKENKQKTIKESDQLFFTRIYRNLTDMIVDKQDDLTKMAKEEIELLKVIGNFRQRAQSTVKQFIDEWPYMIAGRKLKKNTYYKINNLNLKIGDKNLNQQFISNNCVSNAIHKCQSQFTKAIRVPLLALVKYKGFKVFVRACTPADSLDTRELDQAIIHGNCTDNWKSNFLIMDNLSTIADFLKLKPYNSQVHYQRVQIHLGTSLKVIQTEENPFRKIKALDPTRLQQKNNKYRVYYLYDVDEVFPIDLDLQDNVNQTTIRLRPQFINTYTDPELQKTRLVGGSLLYSIEDQEGEKEDVIVAKAAQHFKFVTLYKFVKALDNLKQIPYDSQSLGRIMKLYGVNMRYLGTIFKSTGLPYIKSITQIQCISRIVKNIYRQFQLQFCESVFKSEGQIQKLISQAFSKQSPESLKKMRLKQLKKIESQKSISNATDFLNLVFGSNSQTQQLWKIIKEKVLSYYKVDCTDFMSLPHGYLLKSVCYHCGFQVKITDKTALFMSQKPFTNQDWIKFTCKIQSFQLPELNVYSKTDQNDNYSFEKNKNHLQMSLLIRRSLKKKDLDVLIKLTKYKPTFLPPRQFYSIQNFFYYLLHPNPQNFDFALKVAHTILPSSHPFFTEMYLKYSELKTSSLDIVSLKKAAQSHATRNLGITHWKTAQILSNFNQVEYLNNLKKAEIGVSTQTRSKLYLQIVKQTIHLGRLVECSAYVRKSIQIFDLSDIVLTEQQIEHYFEILLVGMQANYKMRRIQNLVKIAEYMWHGLQKYWEMKYLPWFLSLMKMTMKCFLESYERKHYLYKLVIVLKQQVNHSITRQQINKILIEIFQKCKQSKNHVNWIKQLLIKLEFGYLQLNFKNDFFTSFWKYTEELQNQDLEQGLKQVHDLLHILGQNYFELALLDRIYSFQKGTQSIGSQKPNKIT